MRRKLCFRGHQAYFPRFTAHIAHTKRAIAHALYSPFPLHFSIGKGVKCNAKACALVSGLPSSGMSSANAFISPRRQWVAAAISGQGPFRANGRPAAPRHPRSGGRQTEWRAAILKPKIRCKGPGPDYPTEILYQTLCEIVACGTALPRSKRWLTQKKPSKIGSSDWTPNCQLSVVSGFRNQNTKSISTAYAKPRLALAGGAFASVRTVSVFGTVQEQGRRKLVPGLVGISRFRMLRSRIAFL